MNTTILNGSAILMFKHSFLFYEGIFFYLLSEKISIQTSRKTEKLRDSWAFDGVDGVKV